MKNWTNRCKVTFTKEIECVKIYKDMFYSSGISVLLPMTYTLTDFYHTEKNPNVYFDLYDEQGYIASYIVSSDLYWDNVKDYIKVIE